MAGGAWRANRLLGDFAVLSHVERDRRSDAEFDDRIGAGLDLRRLAERFDIVAADVGAVFVATGRRTDEPELSRVGLDAENEQLG